MLLNALGNIANWIARIQELNSLMLQLERCVEQIMETVKNFKENETLQRQPLKKVDEIDVRFGSFVHHTRLFLANDEQVVIEVLMKESLIILNMTSVYRSGNGYFVNPSVGESLRLSERFEKVG